MVEAIESLILDLLEWLGPNPKPYAEVMDAWRTSCPRLTVWEDATDRGLVERCYHEAGGTFVRRTALGRQFLDTHRCSGTSPP